MADIALRQVAQTAGTVTFEYDVVPGAEGYRYYADGVAVSRTFNPLDNRVTFSKGAAEYRVVTMDVTERPDGAVWPPPQPEPGSARRVAAAFYEGYADVGDVPLWHLHGEQVKADDRLTIVSDPLGQRARRMMRVHVEPGDNNVAGSGTGERAEIMASSEATGPLGEGDVIAVKCSLMLPDDFASSGSGWNVGFQWHATRTGRTEPFPAAQSPFHFQITNGKDAQLRIWGGEFVLNAEGTGGAGSWRKDFPLGSLVKRQHQDYVFGMVVSTDPARGRLVVLHNGDELLDEKVANLYKRGALTGGIYWKQGWYRQATPYPTTLFQGPTEFWTADSLEEALAAAAT